MGNKSTNKETSYEDLPTMRYATVSMKGWRPFMEDAHLAICPFAGNANMGLFGVFDGHGGIYFVICLGPETSEFAKKHFPIELMQNVHFKNKQYEKALKETFLMIDYLMTTPQGNQELTKIRIQHSRAKNALYYQGETLSGSTANVVLVTETHIYCANAGDSRAVAKLKTKINNNDVQQLSFDHKPLNKRQRQRIYKAGGIVTYQGRINANLNLSRAFGDLTFKKNLSLPYNQQIVISVPDIVKIERSNVDFVLMGCDGIWERKKSNQMIKFISKIRQKQHGDIVKVLADLLNDQLGSNIINQKGLDNMTSILIQMK